MLTWLLHLSYLWKLTDKHVSEFLFRETTDHTLIYFLKVNSETLKLSHYY